MAFPSGVYVAIVTPFSKTGDVQYDGLRTNVKWLIQNGVHGIVVLGSTGEFASLDDEARKKIIQVVIDAAKGETAVIVGASAETTEKSIEHAQFAKNLGANGVLILPPWYYRPRANEIIYHYEHIACETCIPIMIYNNPISSKVDIQPELISQLARVPFIEAVKESSGDIKRIAAIRFLTEDAIKIFCGWEDMVYESLLVGATGWVSVIANVAPRMAIELFELITIKRDYSSAWKLYKKMWPFLRYLEYSGRAQVAIKYLLDRMGLCGGQCTSPRLPLTESEKKEVEALAQGLK